MQQLPLGDHENADYTPPDRLVGDQRSLSAIKDQDAAIRFRANQARRTRQLGWLAGIAGVFGVGSLGTFLVMRGRMH